MLCVFSGLPHSEARAQASQPTSDLDQTLNKVFDSTNIALRVNAVATGGGGGSPANFLDADQIFNKIFDSTNTAIKINCVVGCGATGTGGGTVTSVGFSLPANFQVTGSPVTTSGTVAATWTSQSANRILASPNGAAGAPIFRSVVDADLTPSYSGVGSCSSNQWVTGLSRNGAPTCLQPAFASISGTIGSNQLPGATASALGAIQLAGDLSNTAAAPKVAGIQGIPVSSTAPTNGQVNQFNSGLNQWVPATLPSPATFQVNGTNTASQATVNLQSGTNITVANPSAGNVTVSLSGTIPASSLPAPTASTLGGVESLGAVAHQWINSIDISGVPHASQPTFADISGTLPAGDIPNPTASTLGGVESLTCGAGQFLNQILATGAPSCATPAGGSAATFQVNGTNTTNQSTLNFQSGSNITVTNPSAGNVSIALSGTVPAGMLPAATAGSPGAIQLTGDLGGNAATPKVTWLQGYALSATAPSSGQCLVYSGSSWTPGSCGGAGTGLPSSWTTNGANNAVTAQPMSGQDAVPLTLAPNVVSPTADIFDVCSTSPCSSGTKYLAVNSSGNLMFFGNTVTLGASGQSTASYIKTLGGSTSNAGPYSEGCKFDGTNCTYLYFDPTTAGQASLETGVITGGATAANVICTHGNGQCGSGGGGLTSVGLSTDRAWLTVGSSPLTSNGTITLNGTAGLTANEFLATPNGSAGTVGLRSIVAADVPTLNQNTTGSAATITGALSLANTPLTTSQDLLYANSTPALARLPISTVTSGQCLGNNSGMWGSFACSGGSGSFTAGADLSGTASSQTVSKLQGNTLTLTSPAAGQVLSVNSSGVIVNSSPGTGTRSVTSGTSDNLTGESIGSSGDNGTVVTYNLSSGSMAVGTNSTACSGTGYPGGYNATINNLGSIAVTFSPTTSLVVSASSPGGASSLTIPSGTSAKVTCQAASPNNWIAELRASSGGAGSGTVTSSGYSSGTPLAAFSTATNITPATYANVVALFSSCSGSQYLGADGNCHTASGGGGGSPGGSNTQVQFNNSSSFGGISKVTSDGTNMTVASGGTLTNNGTIDNTSGVLKNGPCGYVASQTDFLGNASSSSAQTFTTSCGLIGAATAGTIDGYHKAMRVDLGVDMLSNSTPTLQFALLACLTSNWTGSSCSSGAVTLWATPAGALLAPPGTNSQTASYGASWLIGASGTSGHYMVNLLISNGQFPRMNMSAMTAGLPSYATCGAGACTGGAWTLFYQVTWSAAAGGAAVCGSGSSLGTNCLAITSQAVTFLGY
ncbi:MAG: beta strand repeat-containing protein [Terriglobia bacterium]